MVLSQAGKATGKNKYWFTVKSIDTGSFISVDFSTVKDWDYLEEEVVVNNITESDNSIEILKAKINEFENWKDHKVFEEVENEGQRVISVRWVINKKNKNQKLSYKARLVTRGFEELDKDNIRTDSPTCCKENFRLVLTIILSHKWEIKSLDIKSAFLQGQPINSKIFLKPPKEAGTDKLWKLLITVYGLCDAPRASQYLRIKEVLEKSGMLKSKFDDAIFYWLSNRKLEGLLCCYVDNFAWGGPTNFEKQIINVLKETFSVSSQESETFKYLGLYIDQKNNVITLHQIPYINKLKECDIENSYKELQHAKLIDSEDQQLRGLAG